MSNEHIPMTPSVGRVVHYTLTESDAAQINKRRVDANRLPAIAANMGTAIHVGNPVDAGDVFPIRRDVGWDLAGALIALFRAPAAKAQVATMADHPTRPEIGAPGQSWRLS